MKNININGYTLKRFLGKGGMAEVWYAENSLGKPAAIKIMLPQFIGMEQVTSRFETEAKVMVQLSHPNIRQVQDIGIYENRPFIIMEYLEGKDMSQHLSDGRKFSDAEIEKWWEQCLSALAHTHAQGIIHRDIKPSNIFLQTNGDIKILDFGIAKVKDEISMTSTGQGLGTILYMSPEQIKDPKRVTPATDIYSLAATFATLIKGKSILGDTENESAYTLQNKIVEGKLDLSGIPDKWRAILKPCLQSDKQERSSYGTQLKEFDKDPNLQKDDRTIIDTTEVEIKEGDQESKKKDILPSSPRSLRWPYFLLGGIFLALLIVIGVRRCEMTKDNEIELVRYEEDGLYGYKNKEGSIIIPARYTTAEAFENGIARIGVNDSLYYINASGRMVEFIEKDTEVVEEDEPQLQETGQDAALHRESEVELSGSELYDLGKKSYNAKNYKDEVRWYKKAADKGDAVAMNNLGSMYYKGLGVSKDYALAISWYKKAADKGNAKAMFNLGYMYEKGLGVSKDYALAIYWYKKAADKGDAFAMNNLGVMYEKGHGVSKDYVLAVSWYKKAADKGDAGAMCNLGAMYNEGFGVSKDYALAISWYKKAADKGNADAMRNLGVMYYEGLGVSKDYALAISWFKKAADEGDANTMKNLGVMYEKGHGVSKDYVLAVSWYKKAADNGNADAMYILGMMYENGIGVDENISKARYWYQKNCDAGDQDGCDALKKL